MAAFHINTVFGQNTFKAVIKDSETKEPLIGATAILSGTATGATADIDGLITLTNIPNGKQVIEFRYIGYETRKDTFEFPLTTLDPIEIFLQSETDELDEIVISSTRSSRTIKDIPTRIEFIAGEELEEKGNMKAGDIRMLLSESTGIQTQQTSARPSQAQPIPQAPKQSQATQQIQSQRPAVSQSGQATNHPNEKLRSEAEIGDSYLEPEIAGFSFPAVSSSAPAKNQVSRVAEQSVALISEETALAASAAFAELTAISKLPMGTSNRTLEDLTKDLLRPLLKSWLDQNLPPLVQRLIREEIERVARNRS